MTTAYLTSDKCNGRLVVSVDGYKYCVLSRHRTQFNAHRQFRQVDYKGKIYKVGKWWLVLQGLPRKYQNGRLL